MDHLHAEGAAPSGLLGEGRVLAHAFVTGRGCHLLAAVPLAPGSLLRTRDNRLMGVAARLGLGFEARHRGHSPGADSLPLGVNLVGYAFGQLGIGEDLRKQRGESRHAASSKERCRSAG